MDIVMGTINLLFPHTQSISIYYTILYYTILYYTILYYTKFDSFEKVDFNINVHGDYKFYENFEFFGNF
jgi:hypothetical protein